ncbi:hypothetical protein LVJ82_00550 [Vitreoscilla massiliensis]|uniref:Bro-N domain-containing protein n=1 Tax=Vitreoscilla massiliensis TaxID=1689272 RepID=A0ABY4E1Y1_9NEIS|nr:BRO family protein [Vitreoscilla massiliensis]UOO89504.1 hypothetical protein LVJ82_00550 [Vitreoscilla massiliensis]
MKEFQFQDVTLRAIDKDGAIWLTTKDIAQALYGYSERVSQIDAPFKGFAGKVNRLYNRHEEEFTHKMTRLVDIETTGGKQQVRVFSLRGAHLLGMLARTEKAKEFRRWVLDVIESHNDEIGILTTQYHKALIAYTTGKASASMCGKGLNQWRRDKPHIESTLAEIEQKIQPDIFIQAA